VARSPAVIGGVRRKEFGDQLRTPSERRKEICIEVISGSFSA
jgi:hypothetical protein